MNHTLVFSMTPYTTSLTSANQIPYHNHLWQQTDMPGMPGFIHNILGFSKVLTNSFRRSFKFPVSRDGQAEKSNLGEERPPVVCYKASVLAYSTLTQVTDNYVNGMVLKL